MMPLHVPAPLRSNNFASGNTPVNQTASGSTTIEYRDVVLLYADICGFTSYSKTVSAHEVVGLVTSLFSEIDDLTREVGVYKRLPRAPKKRSQIRQGRSQENPKGSQEWPNRALTAAEASKTRAVYASEGARGGKTRQEETRGEHRRQECTRGESNMPPKFP